MSNTDTIKHAFDLIDKDKSKVLGLRLDGKTISPGDYISRAEAQHTPSLFFAGANGSPSTRYIAISLDPDAPFPFLAFMSPILHWIQADYQFTASSSSYHKVKDPCLLESTTPFVADYVGPAPPPGSSPHRYVFMLYEQPESCRIQEQAPPDGKPLGNWARMRFGLDEWETRNGIGRPVAMNYFLSN